MGGIAVEEVARPGEKRLNVFERWLSLWVPLCMFAGVALGKLLPTFADALRHLEFGKHRRIAVSTFRSRCCSG